MYVISPDTAWQLRQDHQHQLSEQFAPGRSRRRRRAPRPPVDHLPDPPGGPAAA